MDRSGLIICADWGSSSLRLYLTDPATGAIKASFSSQLGIFKTWQSWQATDKEETSRETFFRKVLKNGIDALSERAGSDLAGIPLVVSGMASSSIGLRELPYGSLPQTLRSPHLPHASIPADEHFPHPILLFSGLRKDGDVMRGEEVQAFGLPSIMPDMSETCVLILPGTHSKHMHIQAGSIVDFRTYMTGELYDLLRRGSVLSQSIDQQPDRAGEIDRDAFLQGVTKGANAPLSHALFSLRALHLEGKIKPAQGGSYLSGMLIGSELARLRQDEAPCIILAAGSSLLEPYRLAMDALLEGKKTHILSDQQSDALALFGQCELWRHFSNPGAD